MADPKLKFILEVDDKGTAVVKSFSGGLDDAGKKTKGFSGELGGLASSAAGAVAKVVALGAATVTAVAGMTIKSAISEFAEFETKLTDLGKVGVTDLGAIKAEILALPPALGSATQMTAGYYEVMSAGITGAKESMDTLVVASQLAKTAHMDQATAVQAITGGMKAFNVEAGAVADALMQIEATGASGTTVATLAPLYGEIAGNARALGIEMNATNASFAAMTQLSGSVEKGATKILQVFQTLLNPSNELNDLFADMGGTMGAIKEVGLEGVLQKIQAATGGTAEGLKALNIQGEATSAFALLLLNDMGALNTALAAQQNKAGTLATQWEAYQNTLAGVWDTAKNAITNQLILIGDKLAPKVKDVVADFSAWLRVNQELIQTKIGDWIDGFVESIGKVDFDKLATSVMSLATALATVAGWGQKIVEYTLLIFTGWHDLILLAIGDWASLSDKYSEGSGKITKSVTAVKDAILEIPAVPQFDIFVDNEPAVQAVSDLKTKIEAAQSAASETPIKITANTDPAVRDVLVLKDQIASGKIAMPVDANLDPALDGIEYLKYKIEDEWFYINIDANKDSATSAADAIKDQIKKIQDSALVSLKTGADPEQALFDIEELKKSIEREKAILQIGGESKLAEKEVDDLIRIINKTESAVKVLADTDKSEKSVKDLTGSVNDYSDAADSASRKELIIKTQAAQDEVETLTGKISDLEDQLHDLENQAEQTRKSLSSSSSSSAASSPSSFSSSNIPGLTPGSTASGTFGSYDLYTPGQYEIIQKYIDAANGSSNWPLSSSALARAMSAAYADPEYATAATGGWLDGPSHSSGGIHLIAEGGEYVLNKKAAAAIGKPTLDAMNAVEYANGGMVGFASGAGITNNEFALSNSTYTALAMDQWAREQQRQQVFEAAMQQNEAEMAEAYAERRAEIAQIEAERKAAQAANFAKWDQIAEEQRLRKAAEAAAEAAADALAEQDSMKNFRMSDSYRDLFADKNKYYEMLDKSGLLDEYLARNAARAAYGYPGATSWDSKATSYGDFTATSDFAVGQIKQQTGAAIGRLDPSGRQVAPSIRGYASGTGVSGLPETGLFYGHQGEIVLNPNQSDALRGKSGSSGNAQQGWTVNLSPKIMTGDRQSARRMAREMARALNDQNRAMGRQ